MRVNKTKARLKFKAAYCKCCHVIGYFLMALNILSAYIKEANGRADRVRSLRQVEPAGQPQTSAIQKTKGNSS